MAFELEHDWQGNLATPRARIGENAKTRLLILLCTLWVCIGLFGHQPWKPDESHSISIVKDMLNGGSLIAPVAVGETGVHEPPLFHLSAAASAALLSPVLPMHDGARVATGVWMSLTLLLIGMTGRELWGTGGGRLTTFVFISSIGLVIAAHTLMPQLAALTGSAMGLYALALSRRRPYRASVLLASAISISFLSTGILSALILVSAMLSMPLLFKAWRGKPYLTAIILGSLIALPLVLAWPALLLADNPELMYGWWHHSISQFGQQQHAYFLKTLGWYAWPALPIAAWGLWHFRRELLTNPRFQLLLVFFSACLLWLGYAGEDRGTDTLPLLLPLALLAGGSIETLKRGASGLLNWFGLMLFGSMGLLIWLGWYAMVFGAPAKLQERMQFLSGVTTPELSWWGLLAGGLATLVWLLVVIKARRSNRTAVTDWAVGMTIVWTLLMTLWLPWIDSARSYQSVMLGIGHAIQSTPRCILQTRLGTPQKALLDYYTDLRTVSSGEDCDFHLIQDERGKAKVWPDNRWQLIWEGKRAAERRESFRLYQRLPG
ncbi:ArnT family glycosyltransferase [Methylobacillus flagellatus]|uniref:ArnT family glycosyltransferase n=1 Tax=Methylobacillus flagellatus TaxID=405 RepID=UPI0010F43E00|nr:glycosyl transferase [Methylobacillus flagellatus]